MYMRARGIVAIDRWATTAAVCGKRCARFSTVENALPQSRGSLRATCCDSPDRRSVAVIPAAPFFGNRLLWFRIMEHFVWEPDVYSEALSEICMLLLLRFLPFPTPGCWSLRPYRDE